MLVFTRKLGEGVICKFTPNDLLTHKEIVRNAADPTALSIFVEKIATIGNNSMKLAFDDANRLFNITRIKGEKKGVDTITLKLGEGVKIELLPEVHLALAADAFLNLAANYEKTNDEVIEALTPIAAKHGFGIDTLKPITVSVLVTQIATSCVELEIDAPKDMFRVTRSERTLDFSSKNCPYSI